MEAKEAKAVIECLLFVSTEPLTVSQLAATVGISEREARWLTEELQQEYDRDQRGVGLVAIANGYQFFSRPEYATYLARLRAESQRSSLSYAALETLAIIAYKQPVTRSEIDALRGVNSDRTIGTLLERQLIREAGRRETIGRPILYATTDRFLNSYGLKDLSQLPSLDTLPGREQAQPDPE